jgi:hypothetical protein
VENGAANSRNIGMGSPEPGFDVGGNNKGSAHGKSLV